MTGRFLALLALSTAVILAPAVGQSRETLETKVTSVRDGIVLKWSKKHPWDAQLTASPPVLLAEYRSAAGRVGLDCFLSASNGGGGPQSCPGLAGAPTGQDRELRFRLPPGLTNAPAGPVCLLFRLANQRPLPIRRAGKGYSETARFRYEAWEEAASGEARFASGERRIAALRDSVASKAELVTRQAAANEANGWPDSAGCLAIKTPAFGRAGGENRPIARPEERARYAAQVCTMRVWFVDSLLTARGKSRGDRLRTAWVQPPDLLDALVALLPAAKRAAFLALRGADASRFGRDWTGLGSRSDGYRQVLRDHDLAPHFGTTRDGLDLQSLTDSVGNAIADSLDRSRMPDPTGIAGYVGANLEAYTRCLVDGEKQMQTAFESAVELQGRSEELRESVRQSLIKTCQTGIAKLEEMRAELEILRRRLREAEEAPAASRPPSPSFADRPHDLNMVACTP